MERPALVRDALTAYAVPRPTSLIALYDVAIVAAGPGGVDVRVVSGPLRVDGARPFSVPPQPPAPPATASAPSRSRLRRA